MAYLYWIYMDDYCTLSISGTGAEEEALRALLLVKGRGLAAPPAAAAAMAVVATVAGTVAAAVTLPLAPLALALSDVAVFVEQVRRRPVIVRREHGRLPPRRPPQRPKGAKKKKAPSFI